MWSNFRINYNSVMRNTKLKNMECISKHMNNECNTNVASNIRTLNVTNTKRNCKPTSNVEHMLNLFDDDNITGSILRRFFIIQCQRLEQFPLKELVNPHTNMVPTTHKWDKSVEKLQNITRLKVTCNDKM